MNGMSMESPSTPMPSPCASRASWSASLDAMSALLGMHPRKMHKPPSGPVSTSATLQPTSCAVRAAAYPAEPAPTTIRSW